MALPGNETGGLSAVAFDPQCQLLTAAGGGIAARPGTSGMLRELIAWDLPGVRVRWHILEKARSRFCQLAVRPDGAGYITDDGDVKLSFWTPDGKLLRTVRGEFLAGPIAFTTEGMTFVAPAGNRVALRDTSSGDATSFITISDDQHCSARAACFVPQKPLILIVARVINNKGQISGQLNIADYQSGEVLSVSPLELDPSCIAVDAQFRWACIAGKRRGRGYIQFFECNNWQSLSSQGAHRGEVDGLAVSPDGALVASCGDDNVVRIWRTDTFKTAVTLQQHRCDFKGAASSVAWSADGRWIAYANAGGMPPQGGVFLYERVGELQWRLLEDTQNIAAVDEPESPPRVIAAAQPPPKQLTKAASQWLVSYLNRHVAKKPLATREQVDAWEREHHIKLPADYTRFVSTIGRHKFANVKGLEGLDVSIVGPQDLDDKEYRRDADETSSEQSEPDGLMFAVAINGDCLCFDIRSGDGAYPVYYFDHETEQFEWFAASFAAAVHRLAVHAPQT